RSSSTKWSSTKTCIGSATSEAPRAFSSGWPSKSADAQHALRRHSPTLAHAMSSAHRLIVVGSSRIGFAAIERLMGGDGGAHSASVAQRAGSALGGRSGRRDARPFGRELLPQHPPSLWHLPPPSRRDVDRRH